MLLQGRRHAADTGAALPRRVKSDIQLSVLELLPDGFYRSVLVDPKITGNRRNAVIEAASRGGDLTWATFSRVAGLQVVYLQI